MSLSRYICFSLSVLFTCLVVGCQNDTIRFKKPELVVEGWIENGRNPVVILTTTLPVNEQYQDISDMNKFLVKWAKVTVSDGTREVILTGIANKRYMPPYIYTCAELPGESGKTYFLKVDYKDFHASAETSIPPAASVDSFQVEPIVWGDTLYQIKAFINDDVQDSYYKIFSRLYPRETYYRSFINSTFKSSQLPYEEGITVYPGLVSGEKGHVSYFTPSDSVLVKVARIDETSYLFWHDFEEILATARNPIFPMRFNIKSNIRGGKGYWCGYGMSETMIPIRDYTK